MLRLIGKYIMGFSLLFIVPMAIDLIFFFKQSATYPQPSAFFPFMWAFIICFAVGLLLFFIGKKCTVNFFAREMIFVVILFWVMATLMGALPFVFSNAFDRFEDAWFESASAITTTGITIVYPKKYNEKMEVEEPHPFSVVGIDKHFIFYGTVKPILDSQGNVIKKGIDALPRAIVFWRNFLQWVGALGIVCLFGAFFPLLGIGMRNIFQIEMPGVLQSGVGTRAKETVIRVLKVYVALSIIEAVLLKVTNFAMPFFDAVCMTFSTISTGGLDVQSGGIPAYNNFLTEWILCLFMVAAGVNFTLYFFVARGKVYYLKNAELRAYGLLLLLAGILLTLTLVGQTMPRIMQSNDYVFSVSAAIRHGFFQAVAAMTGTGFVTSSYTLWPMTSQLLILILTFIGGMVGSTTGGMKVSRHMLLFRSSLRRIQLFFKPDVIRPMKVGRVLVRDDYLQDISALFWLVVAVTLISTFIFVASGFPANFSLGIITAMITNSGMPFGGLPASFGDVSGSLAFLPSHLKLLCVGLMFLGRLEYFVILILFVPAFWRRGQ